MSNDEKRPEAELKHGYTPNLEEGFKPKPAVAKATTSLPKPPLGSGAGSQPAK